MRIRRKHVIIAVAIALITVCMLAVVIGLIARELMGTAVTTHVADIAAVKEFPGWSKELPDWLRRTRFAGGVDYAAVSAVRHYTFYAAGSIDQSGFDEFAKALGVTPQHGKVAEFADEFNREPECFGLDMKKFGIQRDGEYFFSHDALSPDAEFRCTFYYSPQSGWMVLYLLYLWQ